MVGAVTSEKMGGSVEDNCLVGEWKLHPVKRPDYSFDQLKTGGVGRQNAQFGARPPADLHLEVGWNVEM